MDRSLTSECRKEFNFLVVDVIRVYPQSDIGSYLNTLTSETVKTLTTISKKIINKQKLIKNIGLSVFVKSKIYEGLEAFNPLVLKKSVHLPMAVYQLYLLALFTVFYTKASDEFSNKIVLHNRIYNVSYNFNETSDAFEFLVEVRVTGWVGFGFASHAPDSAVNYDLAVGGVFSNGTGYLQVGLVSVFSFEEASFTSDAGNVVKSSDVSGLLFLHQ